MEYVGASAFAAPRLLPQRAADFDFFVEADARAVDGGSALCMSLDEADIDMLDAEGFGESSKFGESSSRRGGRMDTITEAPDEGSSESQVSNGGGLAFEDAALQRQLMLLTSVSRACEVELNASLNERLAILSLKRMQRGPEVGWPWAAAGPTRTLPPALPPTQSLVPAAMPGASSAAATAAAASAAVFEPRPLDEESMTFAYDVCENTYRLVAATPTAGDSLRQHKLLLTEEVELDASLRTLQAFRACELVSGGKTTLPMTSEEMCRHIATFEDHLHSVNTHGAVFASRLEALGRRAREAESAAAVAAEAGVEAPHDTSTARAALSLGVRKLAALKEFSRLRWVQVRMELKRRLLLVLLTGKVDAATLGVVAALGIGCDFSSFDGQQQQRGERPSVRRARGSRRGRAHRDRGKYDKEMLQVLHQWWDAHQAHPFPTQLEKRELARKTGLEVSKIGVWFANMRTRKWKGSTQ